MPPKKTAKKTKKTGNNKTKKVKKEHKQFNVDGKTFTNTDETKTRIARVGGKESTNIVKWKGDVWSEEANRLWDELKEKGLIKYGNMSLKGTKSPKNLYTVPG